MRKNQKKDYKLDKPLFVTSLALLLFGLIMTYSASFIYSLELYEDGYYFFKKKIFKRDTTLFLMYNS